MNAAYTRCSARRTLMLALGTAIGVLSGCGFSSPCSPAPSAEAASLNIILTFDDGPLAADRVQTPGADPAELLGPAMQILDTLERRGVRAVFYVTGLQNGADADELTPIYAEGLAEIARRGHVLGYHGYTHSTDVWANLLVPSWVAVLLMDADLDRLESFIDASLALVDLRRAEAFSPLFRQPYGGYGVLAYEGQMLAAARGWIYHGFRIDSVDWTDNITADTPIVASLANALWVDTPEAHTDYVRARLRAGVFSARPNVPCDVLMHVNAFTAARLDAWIDALNRAALDATGMRPNFGVTSCYLVQADGQVDLSLLGDAVFSPQGP